MATSIYWPYTVLMVILLWLTVIVIKHMMTTWPRGLRVIDLMVLPLWWSIESTTFQVTHFSLLGPLVCMFLIWGVALTIYQVFGAKSFNLKKFVTLWWRLIGIVTVLIFVIIITVNAVHWI
ncbi:DUF3397 family protein [Weissella viridescens]|uniref:DUF3397 family protein n=1 Tax=Weissella viridescens TaxID=1629 RepID=UPI001745EE66|nr:DUF3397 family protein [Weissella viridescens]MCB6840340.1 DUF3397 domain-containing protein [Weissella viridescens]MCB6847073.1 DUF3397 domain-containing protein [Weissella viridescens]QOD86503.1 DUF3397 family protein [Weissella viridescens]